MTDPSTSAAVETLGVDGIPGILDEATLAHLLEVELARARRYEHPFSVMRVSLAEGHGGLRHAAGALRLHTRWADSVGVFEGNTLMVVLRDTSADAALAAARKIREAARDEMGPAAAATMTLEIAAWRKGDDRQRMLDRLRPLDYDA